MAHLRDTSGWIEGAGETTMRRYLAGEHHPRRALALRVAYVAELDEALVGFIAGHLSERFDCDGELQWILVAPSHRGSDVATQLLKVLAEWLADHGARRVCVNVTHENRIARRFYSRHGAIDLSNGWMVWPDVNAATLPRA